MLPEILNTDISYIVYRDYLEDLFLKDHLLIEVYWRIYPKLTKNILKNPQFSEQLFLDDIFEYHFSEDFILEFSDFFDFHLHFSVRLFSDYFREKLNEKLSKKIFKEVMELF